MLLESACWVLLSANSFDSRETPKVCDKWRRLWVILERLWVTITFFFFFGTSGLNETAIFNGLVPVGLIRMLSVNFYFRLRQIWEAIVKGIGEEKKGERGPINYFLLWGFPELLSFSTLVKAVRSVSVMFVNMKSWKACQVHEELRGPCSLHQPLGLNVQREEGVGKMEEGKNRRALFVWK